MGLDADMNLMFNSNLMTGKRGKSKLMTIEKYSIRI